MLLPIASMCHAETLQPRWFMEPSPDKVQSAMPVPTLPQAAKARAAMPDYAGYLKGRQSPRVFLRTQEPEKQRILSVRTRQLALSVTVPRLLEKQSASQ